MGFGLLNLITSFFLCRAIEHQVQLNLDPSITSPYNIITEYQRFASALAYSTNTAPNTRVSPDGMKITHREHTLDVAKWRSGLTDLADRITKDLDELCYHEDFGFKVPEFVPDDWSNNDRFYSWTENAEFVPDRLALLQRMLQDETLKLAKVDSEGKLEFRSAAMWDFLDRSARINRNLAKFTFFTNGQTSRISEFVEHKASNSHRPRTCFYDDHIHALWMVVRRVKTETITKRESFIPFKCCPIATTLLLKYFTIVRPVEAHLAFQMRGKEARTLYREFMWVQNCELMTKEQMYSMVPDHLETTVGYKIGVHDYRQIAVEISRVFLGSEMEVEQEELDVLAAQRGHSADMSRFKYASEAGHLPRLATDLLLRFGRISEKWWEAVGVKPGSPPLQPLYTRYRNRSTLGSNTTTSNTDTDRAPMPFDVQDLVATVTTSIQASLQQMQTDLKTQIKDMVAEGIAAALKDLPIVPPVHASVAAQISSANSYYDQSYDDHDDIYEPEPPQAAVSSDRQLSAPGTSSSVVPAPEAAGSAEYRPTEVTRDYLHHLLSLHFPDDPNPSFKSPEQMEAAELAIARQESFVLVLPTGAGKSLVFTLPPFNEPDFCTYVIVPNKALLNDHIDRCTKLGIRTFQWLAHHKSVPDDVQVVFLALESAVTQMFRM